MYLAPTICQILYIAMNKTDQDTYMLGLDSSSGDNQSTNQ